MANKHDLDEINKMFVKLSWLDKKKEIEKMLIKAAKPIIKITKDEAMNIL